MLVLILKKTFFPLLLWIFPGLNFEEYSVLLDQMKKCKW